MSDVFEIGETDFLLNGKPFRIISGAIHYFRIVPEYWRDRLTQLKEFGCNCVETYMPWNLHEPHEGDFRFSGLLDFERFLQTAHDLGLFVILRPGPYICAEWEGGGLPAWLIGIPGIRLRCAHPIYLEKVKNFLAIVLEKAAPFQVSNGGPLLMVQIENEYGAYGNDQSYIKELERFISERLTVPLFTSDQPEERMLRAGGASQALLTANFGSRARNRFQMLKNVAVKGPKMCMEFWCGWFDHWEGPHHSRSGESAAQALDEILTEGGSVNFYMFHGGTNFGFTNGANCKDGVDFQPTVTSYDYDALVSESGELTPKYYACRKVLEKHYQLPPLPTRELPRRLKQENIQFDETASLLENLEKISKPIQCSHTLTMEELGQDFGFVLYRTKVRGPLSKARLWVKEPRDRAQVFLNGQEVGLVYRRDKKKVIEIDVPAGESTLDILVENMGRVNYGPFLNEQKGITHGVLLNEQFQFGWEMYPLPLNNLQDVFYTRKESQTASTVHGPKLYKANFSVDSPADTFLSMEGWNKGVCFLNGFNLGRYWKTGPQRTLYVPAPLLRKGPNELVVLELHSPEKARVALLDKPILGKENVVMKAVINWFLSRL